MIDAIHSIGKHMNLPNGKCKVVDINRILRAYPIFVAFFATSLTFHVLFSLVVGNYLDRKQRHIRARRQIRKFDKLKFTR